jgi:hypothetical protein
LRVQIEGSEVWREAWDVGWIHDSALGEPRDRDLEFLECVEPSQEAKIHICPFSGSKAELERLEDIHSLENSREHVHIPIGINLEIH